METLGNKLRFDIETYGKYEIINSSLRVYKIYENGKEEEIYNINPGRFRINEIFNIVIQKEPFKIEIKCEYDNNCDTDIYIVTPARKKVVTSVRSRLGYNYYPTNPNQEDIKALKSALEALNDKIKEIKEEYRYYNKECLYINN